jgi:hypothetical protein
MCDALLVEKEKVRLDVDLSAGNLLIWRARERAHGDLVSPILAWLTCDC